MRLQRLAPAATGADIIGDDMSDEHDLERAGIKYKIPRWDWSVDQIETLLARIPTNCAGCLETREKLIRLLRDIQNR